MALPTTGVFAGNVTGVPALSGTPLELTAIDHKLVSLAVIVAFVRIGTVVFVSVRFLLHLVRAGRPQLQHLLLKGPSETGVVGNAAATASSVSFGRQSK